MPWQKPGSATYRTWVPVGRGERCERSTGTTDKGTAKQIEALVAALHRGRLAAFGAILTHVHAGTLTLLEVYRGQDDLAGLLLRATTGGKTVREEADVFVKRHTTKVTSDKSRARVRRALAVLCAYRPHPNKPPIGDWPLRDLTKDVLMGFAAWLLGGATTGTGGRPPAAATINGWFSYIVAWLDDCMLRERLAQHPGRHPGNGKSLLGRAQKPKVVPPSLTEVEACRVLDALPSLEDQAYQAILLGTAADATPALGMRRRDLRPDPNKPSKLLVDVPGTKTDTRARTVPVAQWAAPFVLRYLHANPDLDLLFPNLSRKRAHARLKKAMNRLVDAGKLSEAMRDYQMRNHRHSFATRLVRAGAPSQMVGQRMGHVSGKQVEEVYGKFNHTFDDYYRFDKAASQHATGLHETLQREQPSASLENRGAAITAHVTTADVRSAAPPLRATATRDKIDWPSVEQLQARVRRDGYSKVGRDLGVSDNAVRKRLRTKQPRRRLARRRTVP